MKKTITFFALLVCCLWLNSSCDTDPLSAAKACTQLTGLAIDFSNASTAYSTNPSTTTCNAYKTAGNKYLSALKNCSTTPGSLISSTQASIDALTC